MNLFKWAIVGWIIGFPIVALYSEKATPPTHTRSFCAYNKVFVEFEEGPFKWGTIMLDGNGKPIPCSEQDVTDLLKNAKEII